MTDSFALDPPIVIRVNRGHWQSPRTVVLEVQRDNWGKSLSAWWFKLIMNDVVIYQGGGYGVVQFAEYVMIPDQPHELRFDERFIKDA